MTFNPPLFQHNLSLKSLCTLGIGGPARDFISVHTFEEMSAVLRYCHHKNLRTFILGKGSNTLFDDKGFDGVVIQNKIDFFQEISPGQFHVGGGYSFSRLGIQTARKGWGGLEFASGIPGSVGGAIFMNAGACGYDTSQTVQKIDYMDEKGTISQLNPSQFSFSYRSSSFQFMQGAIVGALFCLTPSSEAQKKQKEFVQSKIQTQPYSEKSAGCLFRNPKGAHAGTLIDLLGLKGYQLGGAKISELHANFLINTGNATSEEILTLTKEIKKQVKERYNIELETEVRYIPY